MGSGRADPGASRARPRFKREGCRRGRAGWWAARGAPSTLPRSSSAALHASLPSHTLTCLPSIASASLSCVSACTAPTRTALSERLRALCAHRPPARPPTHPPLAPAGTVPSEPQLLQEEPPVGCAGCHAGAAFRRLAGKPCRAHHDQVSGSWRALSVWAGSGGSGTGRRAACWMHMGGTRVPACECRSRVHAAVPCNAWHAPAPPRRYGQRRRELLRANFWRTLVLQRRNIIFAVIRTSQVGPLLSLCVRTAGHPLAGAAWAGFHLAPCHRRPVTHLLAPVDWTLRCN